MRYRHCKNAALDNSLILRTEFVIRRIKSEMFPSPSARMATNLSILRSRVESALAGRVVAPFTYRDRKIIGTASAGVPEIDLLAGGFPRGGLTEICGPPCSGRTSLLISALAERTAHQEACALVDGRDAFDPHSAAAAGVELQQLLWVRCHNINQALRATDLLIQGGGFSLIALDLSDIPPQTVRYVPLNAWFRFRRAVEDSPTILVIIEQEPNAKTCASLVLQLGSESAIWSSTQGEKVGTRTSHPSACLLDSLSVRAELLRSRMQAAELYFDLRKTGTSGETFSNASLIGGGSAPNFDRAAPAQSFQTQTIWSNRSSAPALKL